MHTLDHPACTLLTTAEELNCPLPALRYANTPPFCSSSRELNPPPHLGMVSAVEIAAGAGVCPQGLLDLPDELLLQIFRHLSLKDVLAARKVSSVLLEHDTTAYAGTTQSCTRLSALSHDRQQWLQILREQRCCLPLPSHLNHPPSWISLSSSDTEALVRHLHIVNRTWLLPRSQYFVPGHRKGCLLDPAREDNDGARTIYSINVFLDRWLLCIYHEKMVEIWDLDSVARDPHKPVLCTSQRIEGEGSFTSAITHLNEEDDILTVAVSW